MKTKKLNAAIRISLFVLIFLIIWFVFSLYTTLDKTVKASGEHFSVMSGRAFSAFRTGELEPKDAVRFLRPAALNSRNLQLFFIARDSGAIEYLFASDSSFLNMVPEGSFLNRSQLSVQADPVLTLLYEERASGETGNLTAYGYYSRVDREELFSIFQPLFIALLFFTILLAILLGLLKRELSDEPQENRQENKQEQEAQLQNFTVADSKQDDFFNEVSSFEQDDPHSYVHEDEPPDSLSLYSPRSGLCWEDFLPDRLTNELKRSASFEQELTLALVSCSSIESSMYRKLAEQFSKVFPMRDMTFEYGASGFAVILPNTSLFTAIEQMREFVSNAEISGKKCGRKLAAGLSSRSGRLISGSILIKEASVSLKRAHKDGDANIAGFRPDPGKFRDYLASKGS
jgi:GGDEF domain-containing protein